MEKTIIWLAGQSALRTWIYRIVVNQARNRQRWWRRRHKAQQVSLDEHIRDHGEFPARTDGASPDRMLDRKELATRIRAALDQLPFDHKTALVLVPEICCSGPSMLTFPLPLPCWELLCHCCLLPQSGSFSSFLPELPWQGSRWQSEFPQSSTFFSGARPRDAAGSG